MKFKSYFRASSTTSFPSWALFKLKVKWGWRLRAISELLPLLLSSGTASQPSLTQPMLDIHWKKECKEVVITLLVGGMIYISPFMLHSRLITNLCGTLLSLVCNVCNNSRGTLA